MTTVRAPGPLLTWPFAVIGLWVLGYSALCIIDDWQDRRTLAWILKIATLPDSVSVIDCIDGAWTDVIITCAVEVDPVDFPALVVGYPYQVAPVQGSSLHMGFWSKVGHPFPAAVVYSISPPEFAHGGWVQVVADEARGRVMVEIYIE